ncbi:DUF2786 domain-containing protein [Acidiferrimicrobium sp. IK]|uniref:DUF2786 domain-containing protein n=1 Tax=Acidiferrimicrobium sp. IK TaxID=2871700 RepID=UPI0021CB4FEC|nr:DUF2786 domain-containing protein [Acidiferrimicrobium sp. IK]MCU4184618.1 DUF2786 domain-containing protein [Acidiferrimicrobium sp. IK]
MTTGQVETGRLDRSHLATAGLLLAKAESTTNDAEAVALAERCYRLLARVITEYDIATDVAGLPGRRRERRHLVDRRASRLHPPDGNGPPPADAYSALRRIQHLADDGASRRVIDLRA